MLAAVLPFCDVHSKQVKPTGHTNPIADKQTYRIDVILLRLPYNTTLESRDDLVYFLTSVMSSMSTGERWQKVLNTAENLVPYNTKFSRV